MSYSAASSALSNREKYPYFYRTYMPDAAVNPARVRLMKDFGWQRVATIHYNHELFSLVSSTLYDLIILIRLKKHAGIHTRITTPSLKLSNQQ